MQHCDPVMIQGIVQLDKITLNLMLVMIYLVELDPVCIYGERCFSLLRL